MIYFCNPSGKIIFFRLMQFRNAKSSITVTLFGIKMLCILTHSKVNDDIFESFSGRDIFINSLHSANAFAHTGYTVWNNDIIDIAAFGKHYLQ